MYTEIDPYYERMWTGRGVGVRGMYSGRDGICEVRGKQIVCEPHWLFCVMTRGWGAAAELVLNNWWGEWRRQYPNWSFQHIYISNEYPAAAAAAAAASYQWPDNLCRHLPDRTFEVGRIHLVLLLTLWAIVIGTGLPDFRVRNSTITLPKKLLAEKNHLNAAPVPYLWLLKWWNNWGKIKQTHIFAVAGRATLFCYAYFCFPFQFKPPCVY